MTDNKHPLNIPAAPPPDGQQQSPQQLQFDLLAAMLAARNANAVFAAAANGSGTTTTTNNNNATLAAAAAAAAAVVAATTTHQQNQQQHQSINGANVNNGTNIRLPPPFNFGVIQQLLQQRNAHAAAAASNGSIPGVNVLQQHLAMLTAVAAHHHNMDQQQQRLLLASQLLQQQQRVMDLGRPEGEGELDDEEEELEELLLQTEENELADIGGGSSVKIESNDEEKKPAENCNADAACPPAMERQTGGEEEDTEQMAPATQQQQRRPRVGGSSAKTAEVWRFFTERPNEAAASCSLCLKTIKATNSSTTGMIRHLKSCHHEQFQILQQARLLREMKSADDTMREQLLTRLGIGIQAADGTPAFEAIQIALETSLSAQQQPTATEMVNAGSAQPTVPVPKHSVQTLLTNGTVADMSTANDSFIPPQQFSLGFAAQQMAQMPAEQRQLLEQIENFKTSRQTSRERQQQRKEQLLLQQQSPCAREQGAAGKRAFVKEEAEGGADFLDGNANGGNCQNVNTNNGSSVRREPKRRKEDNPIVFVPVDNMPPPPILPLMATERNEVELTSSTVGTEKTTSKAIMKKSRKTMATKLMDSSGCEGNVEQQKPSIGNNKNKKVGNGITNLKNNRRIKNNNNNIDAAVLPNQQHNAEIVKPPEQHQYQQQQQQPLIMINEPSMRISEQMALMFLIDKSDFLLDRPAFRQFVQSLVPYYQMPSPEQFRKEIIPRVCLALELQRNNPFGLPSPFLQSATVAFNTSSGHPSPHQHQLRQQQQQMTMMNCSASSTSSASSSASFNQTSSGTPPLCSNLHNNSNQNNSVISPSSSTEDSGIHEEESMLSIHSGLENQNNSSNGSIVVVGSGDGEHRTLAKINSLEEFERVQLAAIQSQNISMHFTQSIDLSNDTAGTTQAGNANAMAGTAILR